MNLFSKFSRKSSSKVRVWEELPTPKPNELLAIPLDNRLWHPTLAVRPSRTKMPDWYKNTPQSESSLKRCYGLADYLRTGYVMPMWASLDVRMSINKLNERVEAVYNVRDSHLFQTEELSQQEIDEYFSEQVLTNNQFSMDQTGDKCPIAKQKSRRSSYLQLINPWLFKTAPGWSCLFIPHQWEPNSDYDILSAVVHTDYFPNVNVIVNVKTNNVFRIAEGTTLYHIIPFERSNSILETNVIRGDETSHKILAHSGFGKVFPTAEDTFGGYKKQQKKFDNR